MQNNINIEFYSKKLDTCRIDIKNSFKPSNSIKLLKCSDKNIESDYPKWFKDHTGSGIVIHSNEHFLDLTVQCINNGTLSIYLRGPDIRNDNNERLPYYINYNSFKINEIDQINQEKLVSHDDYFLVERKVHDGEIINIHISWSMQDMKMDIEEIYKFINNIKNLNDTIEAYNQLFNSLFLDIDLQPLPLMDNIRKACLELLIFVDNICKKYGLNWWLDYGTLLGAVRHGGYIPWDDDIDIGMTRKDGEKLFSIIESEIKENNLDDNMHLIFKSYHTGEMTVGRTIYYKPQGKQFIAAVDISFYDFVPDVSYTFYKNYKKEKEIFYDKIKQGIDLDTACNETVSNLKINKEYDKYIIVGVDGDAFKSYETKNVFPLTQITFEGIMFPCPKNYRNYLEILYGSDYLQIPKLARVHNRTNWFRDDEEIFHDFDEYFKRMKKVNKNFK